MLVDFGQMPSTSRIWIYQSIVSISDENQEAIKNNIQNFIKSWDAHGNPLKASYQIFYGHFIVLAVDESFNQASGCSIDKSVHFFQNIEQELNLNLFNRLHIALWENEVVVFKTQKEIKDAIKSGLLDRKNILFNNLISTFGELENNWQITLEKSWLGKSFPVEAV